jgi:hypothetical protein
MPSSKLGYKSFNSNRAFGVELEVNERVDRNTMGELVRSADPTRQVTVTGWNMSGVQGGVSAEHWSVKTDSTCATVLGQHGHEVASPKLSGHDSILTVGRVADTLSRHNCEVNHRCGVHVHADISDWNRERTGIMLSYWVRTEEVLAQALPAHRRNNQYAKLMRKKHRLDYNKKWSGQELYLAMEPTDLNVHHNREKRVAVNLVGYATGLRDTNYGRKTAELRLPEGTLDRNDVENWTRLYVHFISECAGRPMSETMNSADLKTTLEILGLSGTNEDFLLLSPELHETKVWFLKRILKFTSDPLLFREVIDYLNRLYEPVEKFVEEVVTTLTQAQPTTVA